MSDNEIYLLIKYIKSVLWRVAKCLSYIEEARCLRVKVHQFYSQLPVRMEQKTGLQNCAMCLAELQIIT